MLYLGNVLLGFILDVAAFIGAIFILYCYYYFLTLWSFLTSFVVPSKQDQFLAH